MIQYNDKVFAACCFRHLGFLAILLCAICSCSGQGDDSENPTPSGIEINFVLVDSGDSTYEHETCQGGYELGCCRELFVEMVSDKAQLDLIFEEQLTSQPSPETIDFVEHLALVSYLQECSGSDYELKVSAVFLEGTTLTLYEEIVVPPRSEDVSMRPYNVITIPTGDYTTLVGELVQEME